ncbi:MAG: hypothetical protein JRI74_09395 [Deltaproteobacteria bacterium]|nr:hypothetical protein [Deltaproteobacteria bacterium]
MERTVLLKQMRDQAAASLILVVRIGFEEEMLIKGMAGYEDYQDRVKYKIMPGVY